MEAIIKQYIKELTQRRLCSFATSYYMTYYQGEELNQKISNLIDEVYSILDREDNSLKLLTDHKCYTKREMQIDKLLEQNTNSYIKNYITFADTLAKKYNMSFEDTDNLFDALTGMQIQTMRILLNTCNIKIKQEYYKKLTKEKA